MLGIGAIKRLGPHHAEIKSMHTAEVARGRGIGRAMLTYLLGVTRTRGFRRVSLAISSARQPTTTQSDRILQQLTEPVSGEYVTLPVSRRGPRGVQAGIAGSHAQELAACLTLPGEGDCAIAGHGDYPEPRQSGTHQERMGWYGYSGTGR